MGLYYEAGNILIFVDKQEKCDQLFQELLKSGAYSLTGLLTHSLAYSLTHSLAYSPTHSLTHLLTGLLTHSPTHALTHSLAYSLTHLLTHLLVQVILVYRCMVAKIS